MRTPASVREREERKFRKWKLRKRKMYLLKQLFKEFWNEWGISLNDFAGILAAGGMIFVLPCLLLILGSLI